MKTIILKFDCGRLAGKNLEVKHDQLLYYTDLFINLTVHTNALQDIVGGYSNTQPNRRAFSVRACVAYIRFIQRALSWLVAPCQHKHRPKPFVDPFHSRIIFIIENVITSRI